MKNKRVVVTGIGVLSAIGIGKERFWDNLFKGVSGAKKITLFDTKDLKVKVAGEISDFNPIDILGKEGLMDLDRATCLLLSASKFSLEDAGYEINDKNTHQIGVAVGTTFGSLSSISKFDQESLIEGPSYVNPSIFPSTVSNSPTSRVSIRYNIKGFNTTISTGMCAALDALDYSRDLIRLNRAKTILAGSVECLSIQAFLGFYKLNYLAGLKDDTKALSCPFDRRRNGILFSEGASALLLQDVNIAKKNKMKIYGEVLGIGSCFDPVKRYRYNPTGEGMSTSMKLALEDAGLKPEDIDCIFTNANSTQDADRIESKAIKKVFGNYTKKIAITAIKSMVGETCSASGGLALVAATGALREQAVPPIINYNINDSECDLNYVIGSQKKMQLSRVMINSFDPSGANTSVLIGKYN